MPRAPRIIRPKKPATAAAQAEAPAPETYHANAARVRTMWMTVSAIMLLLIAGWAVLLRHGGLGDFAGGKNPFRSLYEQVKGAFTDKASSAPQQDAKTEQADTARLNELRSQVFPQFTNISEPSK